MAEEKSTLLAKLDEIELRYNEIEKQLAEFCKGEKVQYALSLFSGANRLAPFTRYNVATSYFSGDIERIRKELELKEVPS